MAHQITSPIRPTLHLPPPRAKLSWLQ